MGELLSYSLYGSWTLGGEQPSSPNTIALDLLSGNQINPGVAEMREAVAGA